MAMFWISQSKPLIILCFTLAKPMKEFYFALLTHVSALVSLHLN